jgi:NitT/TauT family transport system ATP-binding protein
MTSTIPAIDVQDVRKVYVDDRTVRRVVAIDGLSLTIAQGEFVCLVGPSGCGKTTLLHMMAGLSSITGGTISASGEPIRKPGADRGMVFQDYALLPWKTVLANVGLGLRIKGMPKARRDELAMKGLERVGLTEVAHSYPRELSGGMKQRVAVARALVNEPNVLLMDEPFAAVDSLTRKHLQEEISSIWRREECSVVFVTHSVDEAVFLADRVICFSPRPASIVKEVTVRLPRPRRWADMEHNTEFQSAREQVVEAVG